MITLRARDLVAAGAVFILCVGASAFGAARVMEARHDRARQVLECVMQMRTAEAIPQVLWDADDLHAAALVWCDAFVERDGRPLQPEDS